MHWLGMAVAQLGGEPELQPAGYPYDPTSRATIFRSYVEYEEKLIPLYKGQAERVDDPHIKRVLEREAWESAIHARQFQRLLDKLSPEEASGLSGGEAQLPGEFLETLQQEVKDKYNEMLVHVRHSWVLQREGILGWQLMDQAMEKMKQLAHFAEDVAEDTVVPRLKLAPTDLGAAKGAALKKSIKDLEAARQRHLEWRKGEECRKHKGLIINLDLTVQQEAYQAEELGDWIKGE